MAAVSDGAALDTRYHKKEVARHTNEVTRWRRDKALAEGILAGEVESVAKGAGRIAKLGWFLQYVEFDSSEGYSPTAAVGVLPIDRVVPQQQKSLLASGRLSVKKMPVGRYNSLYRDYVCGSGLFVAAAVLRMLPIEELVVTTQTDMLNTATGHVERTPLVSFIASRDTFARLNLARVNPSDAISNLVHNMKFLKTKGFVAVEPVPRPERP